MNHPPAKRLSDFDDSSSPKRSKFEGDDVTASYYAPPYPDQPGSAGRRTSADDAPLKQNAVSSDEVAADFKDSLQDLTMNNRYEISNLTIIAKESTEHAMAISRVLENHIRTTAPARKLPALYVLDSIVKNVGTPYTIYLGKNLYSTFMDAYTLVDGGTRKNMEAMLKTWKEAIPGSVDARPVFPADVTRAIENALIKARTMFVQQQQQQARTQPKQLPGFPNRPAQDAWRNTPTPPQHNHHYLPQPPDPRFATPQNDPRYGTPVADYQYGKSPPASTNYNNQQPQTFPFYPPPPPQYLSQPPQPQSQLLVPPPPQPQPSPPPSQFPGNGLNLAALLQATAGYQNQQEPPATSIPEPQLPLNNFPGLGALLQSSSQWAPPPKPMTPPAPAQISTPPIVPANIARQMLSEIKNDARLTNASLKQPRPHLMRLLYDTQPNQCGTCGRRFPPTQEGKARKGRHLDWHFRTNMRMADSSKRGVTRSWFVDEMEWIKQREVDDADEAAAAVGATAGGGAEGGGTGGQGGGGESVKQGQRYIKAPADAALAQYVCPICQEEFKTVWHDEAQEWVWMDAVYKGGRIYHASCIEELAKDRKGTPLPGGGEGSSSVKRELHP